MKLIGYVEKIQKYLCILLLVGIVVGTILQVFSRYVLQNPYMWTEELARTLGIWLVMIGAGVVLKNDDHVGFDLVPEKFQSLRRIFTAFVVLAFSILVIKPAYAHFHIALGRLSSAMQIPLWILYAAMPAGILNLFFWSLITLLDEIAEMIRGKDREKASL
jgi:TRAP-type C4-dicarboxylate transport system permease small subunit